MMWKIFGRLYGRLFVVVCNVRTRCQSWNERYFLARVQLWYIALRARTSSQMSIMSTVYQTSDINPQPNLYLMPIAIVIFISASRNNVVWCNTNDPSADSILLSGLCCDRGFFACFRSHFIYVGCGKILWVQWNGSDSHCHLQHRLLSSSMYDIYATSVRKTL